MRFNTKKLFKMIICTVIAVSTLLAAASCTRSEDYKAYGSNMKTKVLYGVDNNGKLVDGTVMTPGMFSYFLSEKKKTALLTFMYNDTGIAGDSEELWQRKAPDGKTYEEKFFSDVLESAKEIVAANTLLYMMPSSEDPNKTYTLPEEYVEYVKALVMENAVNKYGSVMNFEAYLANFSATLEDYTAIYLMTANIDLLKDALFNNGGYFFTEEEMKDYYKNNYYCAENIYINTLADTKIDGTLSPLSPAEAEKRELLAQEIELFLKVGGTIEEAKEMYTQPYVQIYDNVAEMDINNGTPTAPELGEALKNLAVGETAIAKSAYGVHIVKRVETIPENYSKNERTLSLIKSSLAKSTYLKLLEEQTKLVVADEKLLSSFTMKDAIVA